MFVGRSRQRLRIVRFEECELEPTDAEFYKEFRKYNEFSCWIMLLFLMTVFCTFSLNMDDSVLENGSHREVSCTHNGLSDLQWLPNETAQIFYPQLKSACRMYDYNVSMFLDMSFAQAKEVVKDMDTPELIHCSDPITDHSFSWHPSFIGTCKGYIHKQALIGSQYAGGVIGSIFLGIIADLWGRKLALIIAVCIHFLGTNLQPLFSNFSFVRCLTVGKGIGRAGIDLMLVLLLLEHAGRTNRSFLIVYMTTLGPIGLLMGINMKNRLYGYSTELKFLLSVPSVMFLFYIWYVPESPRWYLSHFHKKKAWIFLNKLGTPIDNLHFLQGIKLNMCTVFTQNVTYLIHSRKLLKIMLIGSYLLTFLVFAEYTKKQFLALSFLRPYSHHALVCLARMFSYMYILLPLMMLRRRLALLWFFLLISIQLFINIFTTTTGYYIVNALLLLCIHAVSNILGLYLAEVFPTCIRGTCLGMIKGFAFTIYTIYFINFGLDPLVSTLQKNIICFSAALVAITVVWFLPEVRLDELPDYKRYRRDFQAS